MSDEKDISTWLAMFGAMLSWVGINAKWTHSLQRKVGKCSEVYVVKDDFNHRVDRLEDSMNDSFNRMYDILERRVKSREE